MARLYANENFPLNAVLELRALGHDITTTFEAGQAGRAVPDEQVLSFAITEKRILLTLNRKHFIRLHASQPNHAGMIVCTVDSDTTALAQRIDEAIRSVADISGHLIRINRPG
jgi:hypothetical protein